jgi:hypothetical protein
MTDATPQQAPKDGAATVTIDRLVLDIPGLDPASASRLAEGLAQRLALAEVSGEYQRIGITLSAADVGQDVLVDRIAAALMERLV